MHTLNKEIKNKTSMLKMQLTTELRFSAFKTYYKTSSHLEVNEAFRRGFPEKDQPTNRIIGKNVKNTTVKEQV